MTSGLKLTKPKAEADVSGCVLAWLWLPLGFIVYGVVYHFYWAWFLTPFFHLPPISFRAAIALYAVFYLLKFRLPETAEEYRQPASDTRIQGIVHPFAFLAIGYVLHLCLR